MKRITLGVPVYNGEQYIRKALDSLLAQTYSDFEIIISDNASTDGTETICREYADRDSRIRYIRQETNLGASSNFNFVFKAASCDYFKWASANDFVEPTLLEKSIKVLDDHPDVILVYPKTRLIDSNGTVLADYQDNLDLRFDSAIDRFRHLILKIHLNNAQNGLFRAEALKRTGLEQDFRASDIVLMAELSLLGKFYELPEYLFYRVIDDEATSLGKSDAELIKFNNPTSRQRISFTFWRLIAEQYGVVHRSRLTMAEKWRLYGFLLKIIYWSKDKLWLEIIQALKFAISSGKQSGKQRKEHIL